MKTLLLLTINTLIVTYSAFVVGQIETNAPKQATDESYEHVFTRLALGCIHKEYSNQIRHFMNSDDDVKPPRELYPAFHGCFDWHSSVHGHWLLVRMLNTSSDKVDTDTIIQSLDKSLSNENLAAELANYQRPGMTSFQRPYGAAWLLQLGAELRQSSLPQAKKWLANIQPLETAMVGNLSEWLPKLAFPIRTGEHSQTAFAFGLMLDYSQIANNSEFEQLLTERAKTFYLNDTNCPLSYEPSGHDFLSPCLAQADLMRRILDEKSYADWVSGFFPTLNSQSDQGWLTPGVVTDKSDGKLAHLDGLNTSRAWMLEGMISGLPAKDKRIRPLKAVVEAHRAAGLDAVLGDMHYMGSHWLGSFATYLQTRRGLNGAATHAIPAKFNLHDSLLTLDAHLDTPALFHRDSYDFSKRGSFKQNRTNIDLPRLREGQLDGGFWVIYTAPGPLDDVSYIGARTSALLRQMSIREMAAKYSDSVELAFKADDAERIHQKGKVVVFQSMENAYPLGTDISLLEVFYTGGLRMLGLVHFGSNQFADSSTDDPLHNGLSELGKELVKEANRLGLIIDASHASDKALIDMMAVSSTPVILSHSGPDGVFEHARNVPDTLLIQLAKSGGVVHVNAFGGYLEALTETPERTTALEALNGQYPRDRNSMSTEQQKAYSTARRQLDRKYPRARSSFKKYLEHLFYTLDLVGVDHVGIGADWDGGGGVEGMPDVSFVPKITQALLEKGYRESDIEKIWSGNVLRLMRDVEAAKTAGLTSPNVLK